MELNKTILNIIFLVLVLGSISHTIYTFVIPVINFSELNNSSISGKAILTDFKDNYMKSNKNSRYIIIGEWFIVTIFLITVLIKSKIRKVKDVKLGGSIKKGKNLNLKKTKSETDLDLLYEMLKNRKVLNISTISKIFETNKEIALEWCKILEDSELGIISYPFIGDPEIKLIGEVNNEKEKKNTEKKKSK